MATDSPKVVPLFADADMRRRHTVEAWRRFRARQVISIRFECAWLVHCPHQGMLAFERDCSGTTWSIHHRGLIVETADTSLWNAEARAAAVPNPAAPIVLFARPDTDVMPAPRQRELYWSVLPGEEDGQPYSALKALCHVRWIVDHAPDEFVAEAVTHVIDRLAGEDRRVMAEFVATHCD